jgi:hypothetical protein
MKIWITKYALTKGIYSFETKPKDNEAVVARTLVNGDLDYYQYFTKNQWCKTKEEALAVAEEMRIKKLQQLDDQIRKLSVKKIKVTDFDL